jgi:hypothetical protein
MLPVRSSFMFAGDRPVGTVSTPDDRRTAGPRGTDPAGADAPGGPTDLDGTGGSSGRSSSGDVDRIGGVDRGGEPAQHRRCPVATDRRVAELEATVADLRAELDRRDEARQATIDRYERLLRQERRRTAAASGGPDGSAADSPDSTTPAAAASDRSSGLVARLRRLIGRLRPSSE